MALSRPHLVVIDPAKEFPELDCFNHIAQWSDLPVSYHLPALYGMESLDVVSQSPEFIRGFVVLGSSSSVNDNQPWQRALESWLRPFLEKGIPTLAICYGHQMIAHIFGGKVGFVTKAQDKLNGFYPVNFSQSRLWSIGVRHLVRSHCEQVLTCPADFHVIAGDNSYTDGSSVGIDAIEHKTLPIWGIQAHPESTNQLLDHFEIPRNAPSHTLNKSSSTDKNPLPKPINASPSLEEGQKLVRAFLAYVTTY